MRKAYITPRTTLVMVQTGGQLLAGSNIPDYHGPAGGRRRTRTSYEDEWDDEEEMVDYNNGGKKIWEI